MGIGLRKQLAKRTLVEEVIEEERFELRVLPVCGGDITKENTLHARQLVGLWCVVDWQTLMMQPPRHMRAMPA
jgi:hypothetical protein